MLHMLEIVGGFIFFIILSLLSLIILPSLFGCLGMVLFLVVLLGLIIFFSVNIAWFILIGLVVYAVVGIKKFFRYQRLPDYDSYLNNNSNVFVDGKAVCKYCGSSHIVQTGLFGFHSRSRYFVCTQCRGWLYKFKVL